MILDDAQEMLSFLETLKDLKTKLPSDPSTRISLTSSSLPEWLLALKASWLGHPSLHYIIVLLAFLVGLSYWWMGKNAHK